MNRALTALKFLIVALSATFLCAPLQGQFVDENSPALEGYIEQALNRAGGATSTVRREIILAIQIETGAADAMESPNATP